ncbi:MAG: methyltransferase domain-containing protein [Deltaproteobacteria bacterium]|nr:methyltransferase domain-containing protein [Deltaproteobacteria bacterium]
MREEEKATASRYLRRVSPCSITPTFRHIKPYIAGNTLDIGFGTGEYLETFPPGSIGVDASEENLRIARGKGLNAIYADINRKLPFPDGFFRTVFCSHVIEHVDSPLNLLREINRVLPGGGNAVLAVPIEKTLVRLVKEDYFKDHRTHLYGLSVECLDSLLEKAGFRVIDRKYNFPVLNRFHLADRVLQSIAGNYCQYFCTMYWAVARKR